MSPRIRIQQLIRRQGRIEETAARTQRRLLATLRREILAELARARGFRRSHLERLLAAVTEFASVAEGVAVEQAASAWATGMNVVRAGVATPRKASLVGVSDRLLKSVLKVTRGQVRSVWSELGRRLRTAIRRAVLGVDDPFEAMKRVTALIRDPKTFGSAAARAQTIVRTEVNRTFSLASAKSADAGAKAGRPYLKWWVSAEDARVRPAHAEAAERYNRAGAIPVEEPFIVDGEKLMQPLDPDGSAANTINCRCVALYREAA